MHFTVKQRIMAFGKQYRAFDESENQVYEVSSMLFSPERRKEVLDMGGNLVAWSEWPVMSGEAVLECGAERITLDVPFMSLTPEWSGSDSAGRAVAVSGDFMRLSFSISCGGNHAATVEKRIFAFADTYEVDVDASQLRPEFALLIAAIVDHKYHSDNN